jgi:hypothetical protein
MTTYVHRLAAEALHDPGWLVGDLRVVEVARTVCSAVAASAKDAARAGGLVTSRALPNPPQSLANQAISAGEAARDAEGRAQVTLLRDIFGNPSRSVILNPTWRTASVVALAQSIYDDRVFDRLPILAAALEDAGCDNADILNHCRQPSEHVRGCWVVDLVLGKS